jgi:O-antigen/teichoic acid export membrane protein
VTSPPRNATRIIASNSFWYALESAFSILMVFATSIPMAHIIGPERLGYYNYVGWLANIGALVAIGIPAVTHKYMAEYLSRGELGVARAIFFRTLKLQTLAAILVTGFAELVVFYSGNPQHRLVSMLQVLSVLPAMIIAVPSQANNAAENMRANVTASVVAGLVYLTGVVASLVLHWDLTGIAASFCVSRTVELLVRLGPVFRRVRQYPTGHIPREIQPAMRTFALQSIGLMMFNIVVWDRSDIVLLKFLNNDIRQISFFSVAFNLAEKTLLIPQVFGFALGVTMMAEFGRDRARVSLIARSAAKYMFLVSAPLLLGMAFLSGPVIRLLYGAQYVPTIPVLAIAASMAMLKPLLTPVQFYFRAHSRQAPLLVSYLICGALNVAIDWALIPRFGALGAAIGNGMAQVSAVTLIWGFAAWRCGLRLDFAAIFKIAAATLAMAPPILMMNRVLPPVAALPCGVLCGAAIFFALVRWLRVLNAEDLERLGHVTASVPAMFRGAFRRAMDLLAPQAGVPQVRAWSGTR